MKTTGSLCGLLLAVLLQAPTSKALCPPDLFISDQDPFNPLQLMWADAETYCKNNGYDGLLSLPTVAETLAVGSRIVASAGTAQVYWVGAKLEVDGLYHWTSDSRPLEDALKTKEKHCIRADHDCATWHMLKYPPICALGCYGIRRFICSKVIPTC